MKKYGKILKDWRVIYKVTQKELSEATGISQQSISYYENDIGQPNIEFIERLADYYNISIDELIGRDYIGYTRKDKP